MASGSELLAVTNAALQSLCGEALNGMEGDVTLLHQEEPEEIFSPLPSDVDTSVVSAQHTAPAVFVKVGKIPPEHSERDSQLFGGDVPSQTEKEGLPPPLGSTPSPLTISARDIEAGSLDFTELVGGLNDSSTSFPLENVNALLPTGREGASTPQALLHATRTPSGTPATGPVRVKVSAKKLREIQSPCLSDRSPRLSIVSVPSTDGGTPGALSPNVMSQQVIAGSNQGDHSRTTQRSLRQGILVGTGEQQVDALDDSIIVAATGQARDPTSTRMRLLEKQAEAEKANGVVFPSVIHITHIRPDAGGSSSHTQKTKGQNVTQFPEDSNQKSQAGHATHLSGRPIISSQVGLCNCFPHGDNIQTTTLDLVAMAKLAATCAAAATTAALASTGKPSRDGEDSNKRATSIQESEKPPTPSKTNIRPHMHVEDKAPGKYGIAATQIKKKHHTQRDENKTRAAHRSATTHGSHSPNISHSSADSALLDGEEDPAVMYLHSQHADEAEQAASAGSRKVKYDMYRSKQLRHGARREGSAPAKLQAEAQVPHLYDQVCATDVLQRIQRLEEIQHTCTVGNLKSLQSGEHISHKNAKMVESATQTEVFTAQSSVQCLKSHAPPDGYTYQFSHVQSGCFAQEQGGKPRTAELPAGSTEAKKTSVDWTPGFSASLQFPIQRASAGGMLTTAHSSPDAHVISRAVKALDEVQRARDQLETQCVLLETENQWPGVGKQSHTPNRAPTDRILPAENEAGIRQRVTECIQKQRSEGHVLLHKERGTEEELSVQASIALRGEPKGRSEKSSAGRKAAATLSGGHLGGKTGQKTLLKVKPKKTSGMQGPNLKQKATASKGRKETPSRHDELPQEKDYAQGKNIPRAKPLQMVSHPAVKQPSPCQETTVGPNIPPQGSCLPFRVPPPTLPLLHTALSNAAYPYTRSTPQPSNVPQLLSAGYDPINTDVQGHLAPIPPITVAIPLGAPCIMSSHEAPYQLGARHEGPHRGGMDEERNQFELVDVCLQTSGEIVVPGEDPQLRKQLVMETLPGIDIAGDSKLLVSTVELPSPLSEASTDVSPAGPTERESCLTHNFRTVEDIQLESVTSSQGTPEPHPREEEEAAVISLEGHQAPPSSPPHHGPLFPPHPHPPQPPSGEGETLSSEELDEKLRAHLETRAVEWVQQELLARVLAQVELPCDPVPLLHHDESTNSCSTCTPPPDPRDMAIAPLLGMDGLQVFVGAGVPVDSGLVEGMVREAIQEQAARLLREAQSRDEEDGGKDGSRRSSEEEYSYTPPESASQSATPTEPTTPLLSTPQPTPPPSPSPDHTPRVVSRPPPPVMGVVTPTVTPPLIQGSDLEEEIPIKVVSTPQATEDEQELSTESTGTLSQATHTSSHTHHTTPSATPPPKLMTPGSPPQSTQGGAPPTSTEPHPSLETTPPPPPRHAQTFSLSASSSSPSPSTQDHSHTLTTSTITDREISMGEYLLQRPPLRLGHASLSEGEVPLSPGDARWYALYASKMKTEGQPGRRRKRRKGEETLQAFVDLKNTPDPSSDSSAFSDSLQSDSKLLSKGEVKRRVRHSEDPFERFLSKLNASSPEDSSTPTAQTSTHLEDNTLSEMPSISATFVSDADACQQPEVTPLITLGHRRTKHSIPHHREYVLDRAGRLSPGEVRMHPSLRPSQRQGNGNISFSLSEGEVLRTKMRKGRREEAMRRHSGVPVVHSSSSPGEVHFPREVRNGIDVINISRHSSRLSGTGSKSRETHASAGASSGTGSVSRDRSSTAKSHSSTSAGRERLTISEEEPLHTIQVIPSHLHVRSEAGSSQTQTESSHSQPGAATLESKGPAERNPMTAEVKHTETYISKPLGELHLSDLELTSQPTHSSSASTEPSVPPKIGAVGPVVREPLSWQQSVRPLQALTIPTGMVEGEESFSTSGGSREKEEEEGVSYSSDFEFSSVSIPGFD